MRFFAVYYYHILYEFFVIIQNTVKSKMRLYERLQTIKNIKNSQKEPVFMKKTDKKTAPYFSEEWESITDLVRKREITRNLPFPLPDLTESLGQALALLIPDFSFYKKKILKKKNLLFFDLETTGLSGGVGTIAFIAAFGRLEENGEITLTQYLLLDYPGESDFLEAVIREFDTFMEETEKFIVTYNGKSFDYPLLRNRCLINALDPPVFRNIDLLHPARFLWKRTLFSCSQAEIETSALGLDRNGDISGSFSPEIWFSFLKTGEYEPLFDICDHNLRDIIGLSSIFAAFANIVLDPLFFSGVYRTDLENLALRWRSSLKLGEKKGEQFEETLYKTGESLLEKASLRGYPKAKLVFSLDLMKKGLYEQACGYLSVLSDDSYPDSIKASALRSLSIDAEHRLKDNIASLSYIESALSLENTGQTLKTACLHRRNRLLKKRK